MLSDKFSNALTLHAPEPLTMLIAFETVLVIVFLSVVALGIALLGDHVAQMLSRNDPWPAVKSARSMGAKRQPH